MMGIAGRPSWTTHSCIQSRRFSAKPLTKSLTQAEVANVSLKRGQVNAVRAALKAGIKPSQIARQFGISQSDVR
jgi:hypothetical protein